MEHLSMEYNDIGWVWLCNTDKLSSLRVNELSLSGLSHHKITCKSEKKAEKVALIKARTGSLLSFH